MKARFCNDTLGNDRLELQHEGQIVLLPSVYPKALPGQPPQPNTLLAKLLQPADALREINAYWESLHPVRQEKIFALYQQFEQALVPLDDLAAAEKLTAVVRQLMGALDEHHSAVLTEEWVRNRSGLRMPEGFCTTEEELQRLGVPRERSYLQRDYWELCVFTLRLKALLPLLGVYSSLNTKRVGSVLRDYASLTLLEQSSSTLMQSDGARKLRSYTDATVRAASIHISSRVLGLGLQQEEFIEWVFAQLVMRHLLTAPLSGYPGDKTLLMSVYNFLCQRIDAQR